MTTMRLELTTHIERVQRGARRRIADGEGQQRIGHAPRITRLLALAYHFDTVIKAGVVQDYAEIARLYQLTRARLCQIMLLRFLAPDIQEEIALMPNVHKRDPVIEKRIRHIAMMPDWGEQRKAWRKVVKTK